MSAEPEASSSTDVEQEPNRPRGREEVREALLDAATELFAARGSAAVSVRDIAKRVRVNHGLVHRHFGSKETLKLQVMKRLVDRVNRDVTDGSDQDLSFLLRQTLKATGGHDAYFRILARALLDGEDVSTIQTRFPVARMLVQAAQTAGVERPKEFVARKMAAGLGWLIFEPYIRAATDMKD